MTTLYVIAVVTGFMAVGIGLWAIAALTVELALMERKRRPRLEPPKRQRKLYVHTIPPKGGVVK